MMNLSVDVDIPHALSAELLSAILETLDGVRECLVLSLADGELVSADVESKGPEVVDDVSSRQQGELKEVNDSDNCMI